MEFKRVDLETIGEYLRGTCKDVGDAVTALDLGDIDESRMEAALLEADTERCVGCDWWHEVHELQYSERDGGGLCEQCCDEAGVEFE